MIGARQLVLAPVSNGLRGRPLFLVTPLISELPPGCSLNVINLFIFVVQIIVTPDSVWLLHPECVRSLFCSSRHEFNLSSCHYALCSDFVVQV
jgi:hypothetical protein